jgi:hypothetical protein
MRGSLRVLAVFAILVMAATAAQALNLYGNSAGTNEIDVINPATGAVTFHCLPGSGNGRGIVVVGTTAYYTVASSNNIFALNITNCASMGVAFSVAGATGLSTIAYDGTNFWIGDYSGTNQAFNYTPTGTLLKTIHLANCVGFCDGLEYFNGKLISNRGDAATGPYDVYDLNGNLVTPAFITTAFPATGIAFDGTNFAVSDIFNGKIHFYNGTTGAEINNVTVTGGANSPLIEDLSFDYQQVLPTPTPTVGTPVPTATPTSRPAPVVVPTLSFPMLGLLAAAIAAAALVVLMRR